MSNWASVDEECRVLQRLHESPEIFEVIEQARDGELSLQRRLREVYPAEIVRAAITLAELRRRAHRKFTRAADMWFDRRGLEQSTSEIVALHKSRRFSGGQPVHDLCSGIGGDALALAQRGRVRASDQNPASVLRTAYNAAAYGVAGSLDAACEDVNECAYDGCLIHLDPDRRQAKRRRAIRIEDYSPGLEFIRRMMQTAHGGAIKVSPVSDFASEFQDCEIELVSLEGECREATVWFGNLAGQHPRRATVLPSGETLSGSPPYEPAPLSAPRQFLFNPDPSIVRAGLVDVLAAQCRLNRLDEAEEYLTGDDPVASPFLQAFRIETALAFDVKTLRQTVRRLGIGELEIKARHTRVDVELLRKQLRPRGELRRTLVIARCADRVRAILAERFTES